MKLPSKYIALLVILSLTGIFAYQGYWLVRLYRTQKREMEQRVVETMRLCDYNEMMLRISRLRYDTRNQGHVTVETGYDAQGASYVHSSAQISDSSSSPRPLSVSVFSLSDIKDEVQIWRNKDSIIVKKGSENEKPLAALQSKGGMESLMLAEKAMTMQELAIYLQRGLHAGLDLVAEPDIQVYDSLLQVLLKEEGLTLPYRLMLLHSGQTVDSTYTFVDTLAVTGTPGYRPTPKARGYEYSFDMHSNRHYLLHMEPFTGLLLKQMAGILLTSLVILIVLGFSFWFLIRILLRQRSLEEMKSDFTNNITHELKTPIAVAYAANDALLNFDAAADAVQRDKYLNICREQLQRLGGLVEQILSMSMERRKTFTLHLEEIPLRELLDRLVEQHTLKAGKPVSFSIDIAPESLTVTADRIHLYNMLSNLMDNAVKYSPGKASVDIRCRRTADETGRERTEIAVADRGTGIPAEQQRYVFDKFYRIPAGNIHNVKGYGLGLFYVKTLAERHGGHVGLTSEPGRGSVFTLIL